jgi:hypothetical protein
MVRLPKPFARPAAAIGLSADLLTLATAIAVGGPIVVGVLAQSLLTTLALLVVGLGLLCLWLAYALRRQRRAALHDTARLILLRRQNRTFVVRFRAATTVARVIQMESDQRIQRYREEVLATIDSFTPNEDGPRVPEVTTTAPPEPVAPSPWLPDPADLASFCMTDDQLADVVSKAADLARSELGADSAGFLDDMILYCDLGPPLRTPLVRVEAWSEASVRKKIFVFEGALTAYETHDKALAETERPEGPHAPWLLDGDFRRLIHDSWRRMKPFHGIVILGNYHPGHLGISSPWYICYLDLDVHTKAGGNTTLFGLDRGTTVRLEF